MSEMSQTSPQAPRHGHMANTAAQALFEAAERVTRHHLGKLDERFRGLAETEEVTGTDWNSDVIADPGQETH